MSRNIVLTPKCPICHSLYDCMVIPKVLYPCGHGICSECLVKYSTHEENDSVELKCPLCREPIIQDFENYDLQSITNDVNTNTIQYWSQRLLETLDKDGEIITLHEKLIPFSKTIVMRMCYRDEYKIMDKTDIDIWTKEDKLKVRSLCRSFIRALERSDASVDHALKWIEVLNVPPIIENCLVQKTNKYYVSKQFLGSMDATWLMDALLD